MIQTEENGKYFETAKVFWHFYSVLMTQSGILYFQSFGS